MRLKPEAAPGDATAKIETWAPRLRGPFMDAVEPLKRIAAVPPKTLGTYVGLLPPAAWAASFPLPELSAQRLRRLLLSLVTPKSDRNQSLRLPAGSVAPVKGVVTEI